MTTRNLTSDSETGSPQSRSVTLHIIIFLAVLALASSFVAVGCYSGWVVSRLYTDAAHEILVGFGVTSGVISASLLIEKRQELVDILNRVWADLRAAGDGHVVADCLRLGVVVFVGTIGAFGAKHAAESTPAPTSVTSIWQYITGGDTVVVAATGGRVTRDLDSIVTLISSARRDSGDSATAFPVIGFPQASGAHESHSETGAQRDRADIDFTAGVRPDSRQDSVLMSFARLLEGCADSAAKFPVVVTVRGFASSDRFDSDGVDTVTSRQWNLRAANLRAASTESVLVATLHGDHVSESRVKILAPPWSTFEAMVAARPFIDNPQQLLRPALRKQLDPGRLNRRAEVRVVKAGTCAPGTPGPSA
jgi:hypothetical protein